MRKTLLTGLAGLLIGCGGGGYTPENNCEAYGPTDHDYLVSSDYPVGVPHPLHEAGTHSHFTAYLLEEGEAKEVRPVIDGLSEVADTLEAIGKESGIMASLLVNPRQIGLYDNSRMHERFHPEAFAAAEPHVARFEVMYENWRELMGERPLVTVTAPKGSYTPWKLYDSLPGFDCRLADRLYTVRYRDLEPKGAR